MKNDTPVNVLISYAYLYGEKELLALTRERCEKGEINLMIDSGAFTKFNTKKTLSHINVKDYTAWLKDYAWMSEKYVMLDVIGNEVQSRKNYEYMLSQGLNPMYVVTLFDKDYDYINGAVSRNADICVAGGATNKSDWMTKRFQDIYRKTDKRARMHGLGYFTFPRMLQLNLTSIDASSWKTAPARFGQTIVFNYQEGKTYRIAWPEILHGKKKFPIHILEQMKRLGITPELFMRKELHKKEKNIDAFLSLYNNINLQRYCYVRGLQYFFAVGCKQDLERILYVSENIKTITYQSYIEHFCK